MLCNACHIVHAIIPISNNGQHQQLHNISLNQESINLPNLECMRPWVQLQTGCRRCMWSLFKNTCNYILWLSVMKVWSQRPKENNQNRHACCIKFHLSVCKDFLGKNTESYRHNFTSSDRSFVFDFIWSCFFGLETWVLFGDPFMWLFFLLLHFFFSCLSAPPLFSRACQVLYSFPSADCEVFALNRKHLYIISQYLYIYIISIASPSKPSKPCRDRTQPILQLNVPL